MKQHVNSETLLEKVHEIVAEAMDLETSEIDPTADLFEDLALDSIGIVMVYVEFSVEFGIPEPPRDADLSLIRSVENLTQYVAGQLAATGGAHDSG
ncbi:MAG: acyl carrier protein [Hoeflea sp.]|uniref:acyl carrier protein n=1 Tax=Hoeflea sp. TaxID=1940281 RepID=UPI0032EAE49D